MKRNTFDPEFIKKAARLLKGEKLRDDELQSYRLHGDIVKNYRRLKINVTKRNEQWSMDLGEMNDLARFNNGYRYLFVCLDIYSRYAFVRLLKNKTSQNVAKKFDSILQESRGIPSKIQCDEGTEFQKIRKDKRFIVFHTYNREIKASHAERFIRTLKLMIRRTLTVVSEQVGKPIYKYVDMLPHIVEKYNDSPHRGIHGLTPRQVYNGKQKISQHKTLANTLRNTKPERNLLKENDRVRIVRAKNSIFEKSSLRVWTREVYVVDKVLIYDPVIYKLKDLKGEPIEGIFYRQDLQKQ